MKKIIIYIIILVAVVILGRAGYVWYQGPLCCKKITQSTTVPSTTKTYSDDIFGFSVTYPQSYLVSTDDVGKVNIKISGTNQNPITIKKANNYADDSNGKFGKFILSYGDSGWIVQRDDVRDGSLYTQSITPFTYTNSGLPVFSGGIRSHGWGTFDYIIALSKTKFLIISGPENLGEGVYNVDSDPTLPIVKSITAI